MQTLKEAREARGIKQKAVAKYCGVSRQTYYNYEKKPETMPAAVARLACDFVGCDFNEIFFGERVNKTQQQQPQES